MPNALSELKNLKPWQKYAIAGGGVGMVIFAVYERKKNKAEQAAAAATTTAGNATSGMVTDPSTGESYSATALDPVTDETYGAEIAEYGSVAGADEAVEGGVSGNYGQAALGDSAGYIGDYGSSYDNSNGSTPATTYATNAQWSQAVEAGLTDLGYSSTDVAQSLGYYLAGRPLVTLADGQSSEQIILSALAEYGNPPVGTFSVISAPVTTPVTTGTGTTSTVPTVPAGISANTSGAVTTISWSAVTGATGYEIQVATPAGKTYADSKVSQTHAVYDNLVDVGGTGKGKGVWHFKLRATNAKGSGPWSAVKTFTP
jgi:hypothetical protein